MTDLTRRLRIGWTIGALTGTTISCAFYGGIGFLLFGMAGLHGGIALAICLAVIGLVVTEILYAKHGGIDKVVDIFM